MWFDIKFGLSLSVHTGWETDCDEISTYRTVEGVHPLVSAENAWWQLFSVDMITACPSSFTVCVRSLVTLCIMIMNFMFSSNPDTDIWLSCSPSLSVASLSHCFVPNLSLSPLKEKKKNVRCPFVTLQDTTATTEVIRGHMLLIWCQSFKNPSYFDQAGSDFGSSGPWLWRH